MVNKAFISPKFMQKTINKQNSYFLLAFFQSGSVPLLDMHESKHFLPGQFVHSDWAISDFGLTLYFRMDSIILQNTGSTVILL